MPTLLRYDLTTDPFPLQASPATGNLNTATLIIVASNPNPDPVRHAITLRYLTISIPVGASGTDLTPGDAHIDAQPPAGWNPPDKDTTSTPGIVTYTFHPNGPGQVQGAGLNFVFKIGLNSQTGTAAIDLMEASGECTPPIAGQPQPSDCPTRQLFITKFPNGWGEVSFRLDNTEVPYHGTTTLHWQGPAQATYSIEYALGAQVINVPPGPAAPALGAQGEYPGPTDPPLVLDQTTVFTLLVRDTIFGQHYQTQQQLIATVNIPAPQINLFRTSPGGFSGPETPVKLLWQTTDVSELDVTGVGSFTGAEATQGSVQLTRSAPDFFQAQAFGVTGYTGPPAAAQACFGHEASSGPLQLNPPEFTGSATATLWTLVIDGNRPFVDLNVDSSRAWDDWFTFRIWLAPKPGVQIADLGGSAAAERNEDLSKATYSGSLPQTDIFNYQSYFLPTDPDGQGTYRDGDVTYPLSAGATWGVKFSDNRVFLVWFEGMQQVNWQAPTVSFVWYEF